MARKFLKSHKNYGSLDDFEIPKYKPKDSDYDGYSDYSESGITEREDYIEDMMDSHISEFEQFDELPVDDIGFEEPETPDKPKKPKRIKKSSNDRADYVDEHHLSIAMAMFKNWDGFASKDIIFQEPWKTQRAKYDLARARYDALIKEGLDKRNQKVQEAFMESLTLAISVYPNEKEIAHLYKMMRLICSRCINLFGRNYNFELDDILGATFERWLKYRYSFEPLKRSEISGTRVNAFAYMTQMIKNTIYEFVNKANAKAALEEKLRGEVALFESFIPLTMPVDIDEEQSDSKDYVSPESVESQDFQDSDIIGILMKKVTAHTILKELILDVETTGYSEEEILNVISGYDLMKPLEDVLSKNRWAF